MDLKLGFCVLLSLILLVTYGTESRKIVEGNSEDNHEQALKEIYGSGYVFRYYKSKQGPDEHNHQEEISGFGNPFRSWYKQGSDEQQISGFGDPFRSWYKQGNDKQVKKHDSFFFLMDDLKIGKIISLSFETRRNLTSFPIKEADSFPFSQDKSMENTLRICEDSPIKGEAKYCATSAEAMLDFVQGIIGEKNKMEALTTITSHDFSPLLHRYIILDAPQRITAPKMVACHMMPCPYAVFYCHHTINNKIKVFKVSLGNINGDRLVEAIVVCHLDTSEWNPSHESFQTLGVLPGTSPICHFFTSGNDLVWIPKSIASTRREATL
ncbi:BURP domain-containing protein BNM2A-like [Solanum dulcamara]|uniref:BURP domain-containing protein BNM2A-like n=1 Tax=Solanum dulcamara TaxID=45834 RepID=UPI002486A544|nr:BURP domain-containing protein BNM2A-like [Solanum dulcamara]